MAKGACCPQSQFSWKPCPARKDERLFAEHTRSSSPFFLLPLRLGRINQVECAGWGGKASRKLEKTRGGFVLSRYTKCCWLKKIKRKKDENYHQAPWEETTDPGDAAGLTSPSGESTLTSRAINIFIKRPEPERVPLPPFAFIDDTSCIACCCFYYFFFSPSRMPPSRFITRAFFLCSSEPDVINLPSRFFLLEGAGCFYDFMVWSENV